MTEAHLQKQLEKYQDTLGKLEVALGSVIESIVWTDEKGLIQWANKPFEKFTDQLKIQFLGSSLQDQLALTQNNQPISAQNHPVALAIQSCNSEQKTDYFSCTKDNKETRLEITSSCFQYKNNPASHIFTIRDVTRREILKSQLLQAQKLESLGTLAAGIAHEINTPMQYISNNLKFLQEEFRLITSTLNSLQEILQSPSPENISTLKEPVKDLDLPFILKEIPKALQQTIDGAKQVASIVQSIKIFSHPGSNNISDKALINLNNLIQSVVQISKNEWKLIANVETDLDHSLPEVFANQSELSQAFLNIIINAAHAIENTYNKTKQPGSINIKTFKNNNNLEVHIKDSGQGIPQELQGRIFDPFFTTKEVGKGTGQGLNQVRNCIIKNHNGSINLLSSPEQGTTFQISIPINEEPTQ